MCTILTKAQPQSGGIGVNQHQQRLDKNDYMQEQESVKQWHNNPAYLDVTSKYKSCYDYLQLCEHATLHMYFIVTVGIVCLCVRFFYNLIFIPFALYCRWKI